MKLSKLNIILAAALTLVGANAFSQKTYSELQQISSLNRGVSGLRSMQDGEHYTVSRGGAILRHSYTDKELCDTLYKGRFASYEFSPTEEMLILGNNYRPIYRHSSTVDYQIVSLADGKTITELKDVRDLTLSPD